MSLFKKLFGGKEEAQTSQSKAQASKLNVNEPPPGKMMHTLDQSLIVEPFGKINYWELPGGGKRIRAYFLMEKPIEGAQTGVAIDGSGSMQANFGLEAIHMVRPLNTDEWVALVKAGLARQRGNTVEIINFGDPRTLNALINFGVMKMTPPGPNIVEEQARKMTEYLIKFDADGGTTVIYWALGQGGREIKVMGDLTRNECPTYSFSPPENFGSETHLLPAIKYFVDRFKDARWGMYVFITDGALNDLEAVKRYSTQLARDIVNTNKRQNDLKFVLIGVGEDINEAQMEELDDLETGTDKDLWDHKIAKDMKQLAEIFAEVVSESVIVVPGNGVFKDANGNVVKDYRDSGLPALMWFDLPPDSQWFSLEVGGQTAYQPLAAGVQIPSTQSTTEPTPSTPPVQPAPPAQPTTIPCIECHEPLPPGTKVCPRCRVSQDEIKPPQPAPPTPEPEPAPVETPPAPQAAPTETGQLTVSPAQIDFGTTSRTKISAPPQTVQLHNNSGNAWNGSVRSSVLWLEVTPATLTCPAGGEVTLTATLTSASKRLKPKTYSVPDALVIEGEGQTLQVSAQVNYT